VAGWGGVGGDEREMGWQGRGFGVGGGRGKEGKKGRRDRVSRCSN
jgi:hypothetical protein